MKTYKPAKNSVDEALILWLRRHAQRHFGVKSLRLSAEVTDGGTTFQVTAETKDKRSVTVGRTLGETCYSIEEFGWGEIEK